jgi:purine-binding chemotaxis protein CheW
MNQGNIKNESNQVKTFQVVTFRLGMEAFGVDILKVREIVRIQKVAKVPQTPDYVEGMINLRGNVIPILNLRQRFGLGAAERDAQTRIIVFGIGEKTLGVVVDRVDKVLRLPLDQIEPPPEIGSSRVQEYVTGVGKLGEDLILILEIDRVLTDAEIVSFEELEQVRQSVEDPVKPAPARTKPKAGRSPAPRG